MNTYAFRRSLYLISLSMNNLKIIDVVGITDIYTFNCGEKKNYIKNSKQNAIITVNYTIITLFIGDLIRQLFRPPGTHNNVIVRFWIC